MYKLFIFIGLMALSRPGLAVTEVCAPDSDCPSGETCSTTPWNPDTWHCQEPKDKSGAKIEGSASVCVKLWAAPPAEAELEAQADANAASQCSFGARRISDFQNKDVSDCAVPNFGIGISAQYQCL